MGYLGLTTRPLASEDLMSWLRSPESTTSGADVLDRPAGAPWKRMTALQRALSLDPSALERLLAQGASLLEPTTSLTGSQARLVALVVSATNGCSYAVAHFGPALAESMGDEMARAVARDYREANLAARDRVLLDYAVALTCEPSERKREDVERVREYGFDDAAILRATHLAAWVGLLDRLASGLGVETEPEVTAWEFGTQR
jgi:uncharacterized peroxidase-related enzyme